MTWWPSVLGTGAVTTPTSNALLLVNGPPGPTGVPFSGATLLPTEM